jgi:hypothetical protein
MIFKLGKNLVKYGGILLFILILAVSVRSNLKEEKANSIGELNPVAKTDSLHADQRVAITHYAAQKVQEYDNKGGNNSHSSLNSVNLIIYMIYQVTNKSLR